MKLNKNTIDSENIGFSPSFSAKQLESLITNNHFYFHLWWVGNFRGA